MNTVLHIEDNHADVMLMNEVLEDISRNINYLTFSNGKEVLDYLQLEKIYPKLILLDLNTPIMNGQEFLRERQKCNKLNKTPVIVLSTSDNYHDIECCYKLHANAYILKTQDFYRFKESIKTTLNFWLDINQIPE